jgi:hypothetical protein
MDDEKNIGVPNNSLFSKQWLKEYWTVYPGILHSLVLFFYGGYKFIYAFFKHRPDYEVILYFGVQVFSIGLSISCLNDWAKKEHPQQHPKIWWTSSVIVSLSIMLFLLSALRGYFQV